MPVTLNAKQLSDNGPAVVMLHGLFGSWQNLGSLARALAEDFSVHLLDLRNHGQSPHADTMSYAAMAEDVVAYLERTQLNHVRLFGHSMGGKVAMHLALHHGDAINKVAVGDIAPVAYDARHTRIFEGLLQLDLERLENRREADAALQPHVPETAVRQFLLKNLAARPEGGFRWRMNLPVIHREYPEIMQAQQADTPFNGPLLLLKGGDSDYIQPEHRDQVLSLFPHTQFREVQGTGHWLHAEKPAVISRLVQRFFHED